MRFDDMIATVLAQPADRPDQLETQWRQLVDLLAQGRAGRDRREIERAYDSLRQRRADIAQGVRAETAQALSGLGVDPEMLAFFAEDESSVSGPLIAKARLEGREWLAILPRLGAAGRSVLRRRSDLPADVVQALRAFEPGDLEPRRESSGRPPAQTETQIRELVDRIEAHRRRQVRRRDSPETGSERAEDFRWEAGSDGIVRWVDGAPREALVGQGLATIAAPGRHGIDGQAAGAFKKRSPFRDARLSVAGEGPCAGDWRISGVPFFDPAHGAFLGYRGTARRPRLDEVAQQTEAEPAGLLGTRIPADSLRQLIHELRTPLNAILGFAEMIEGQIMGPAPAPSRERATFIVEQARRLLAAVDDLDTAAKIETRRLELEEGATEAVALLERLREPYERIAVQRGAYLVIEAAPALPPARIAPAAAERIFSRLLAATIGLAEEGEAIRAAVAAERRGDRLVLRIAIDRPRAVDGADEAELLDPGYGPGGTSPDSPSLGLGFALRLVRNLAEAAGGGLLVGEERILLHLPAVADQAADRGQSEETA